MRKSLAIGIALLIVLVGALQALHQGEVRDWAGMAVTAFVLVLFFVARVRHARRRPRRERDDGEAG